VRSLFVFIIVGLAVALISVGAWSTVTSWRIMRIVREIDPSKADELTETMWSSIGARPWVNPRRLFAFVWAGDSLGSAKLAHKMKSLKRLVLITWTCFGLYVIGLLVLVALLS